MKTVHLWSTTLEPAALAPLFGEARKLGLRIGWLDLAAAAGCAVGCPGLEPAVEAGAFRAVAAVGGQVVALKPVAGAPVLADLVREYFGGCSLVLVVGLAEAPELSARDGGYLLRYPDGVEKEWPAPELARALRRPRPGRSAE